MKNEGYQLKKGDYIFIPYAVNKPQTVQSNPALVEQKKVDLRQREIRVGVMAYDANKTGKAASKANVVGSEVFLFHGSDAPTQYDPGFAKTFSIGANSVEDVRMYRDEGCRSDILAVDWSEDVKVVSTLCAKRITVS